ncbi:MAG: radical SAM protein [Nitrospirae bacterium]|nr:radical SAM protein [Nitrospirota bacterium]
MKPKFLFINPWIYDFAAVNLWSRPLGLLKVAEYLSQFDVDLSYIDCTDVFKTKRKYGAGKYPRQIVDKPEALKSIPRNFARYGISIDVFKDKLQSLLPFDIVFVTSIMSYWYPGVQKAIEIIKSLSPDTPVILGGIYATLYHRHASENSGADHIFKGNVGGSQGEKIETMIENCGCDLKQIKSSMPYYKLGFYEDYPFAPVITSSGCPYRCTYCASFSLFNGFVQRETYDIVNDIKELYNMGVRDFAFYDDALLINADIHMKVVLREIIKSGLKVRFHCPNGVHARFIDDELAYLMKQSGFSTLRLSLETVNSERQVQTGGKVSTDIFRLAVQHLKRHGFTKEQVGVYLMYGLPGQGLKEVEEGVEFIKKLGVRINLTEFSPLPETSCWTELTDKGIISDNIDPLLTNNSVFSLLYSGYDLTALEQLKLNVKEYNNVQ